MTHRQLMTSAIVIAVVGLGAVMYYYAHHAVVDQQQKCQAKGLDIFEIADQQLCRDHSTGLLYAP
jgi:uncharacterized protein HemX